MVKYTPGIKPYKKTKRNFIKPRVNNYHTNILVFMALAIVTTFAFTPCVQAVDSSERVDSYDDEENVFDLLALICEDGRYVWSMYGWVCDYGSSEDDEYVEDYSYGSEDEEYVEDYSSDYEPEKFMEVVYTGDDSSDYEPTKFMEVVTLDGALEVTDYSDTIIIKNNSNSTLYDLRIMLSPEIAKSFYVDTNSIRLIEPNANATVSLRLLGDPNKNLYGEVTAYDGDIMVMATNHSPVILPVKINSLDFASGELLSHRQAYMKKVADMAEQRYNRQLPLGATLDAIVSEVKTGEQFDYEVRTQNSNNTITSPSDELVIRNLSDKPLRNVRIFLPSNVFLADSKAIHTIESNSEVVVHLISKIDATRPHERFTGELVIAPVNGRPMVVPFDIPSEDEKEQQFVAKTLSGSYLLTGKIVIKNSTNRTMDAVTLRLLPQDLTRTFHLSTDSFKSIAPGGEVIVDYEFRPYMNLRSFTNDYSGELVIAAERHTPQVTPINLVWGEVSSDHFIIYSRENTEEIAKATRLSEFLESKYAGIAERFGEVKSKTVIYVLGSVDELKLIKDSTIPYHYSYFDDIGFIASSSDDLNEAGLHVFVYRSIMNNYPSVSNRAIILSEKENWLADGITNYLVTSITGKNATLNSDLDAFARELDLQGYELSKVENHASTYTFFSFLNERYGEKVIDKTLDYLGSGMISNHRCSTLESCSVLRAVYDASGLDMDDVGVKLNFRAIFEEWVNSSLGWKYSNG